MARPEYIPAFVPTPGLTAEQDLLEAARLWKIVEQRSLGQLIKNLPENTPHPPLLKALMERGLEVGTQLINRGKTIKDTEVLRRLLPSLNYLEQKHAIAWNRLTPYWVSTGNTPHIARNWRNAAGDLQRAILIVAQTSEKLATRPPYNTPLEAGARLLAGARAFRETDIRELPYWLFSPESLQNMELFEDEIRRRLRVLKYLANEVAIANIAYPTTDAPFFKKLDDRIKFLLSSAHNTFQIVQNTPEEKTLLALKVKMEPVQNGLTLMLIKLEECREKLTPQLTGRTFLRDDGQLLMRQFAKNLRASAPLLIGALISGYFAYQTWQQTKNLEKVAFNLGSELYQNLTTPPLLVSAGLMIVSGVMNA